MIHKKSSKAIRGLKYAPVPAMEKWRVGVVKDLLEIKWNMIEIDCFIEDTEEIDTPLDIKFFLISHP